MSSAITLGNVLSSTGTVFTSDNSTYTFPANVSKVRVFVWGAGGSSGNTTGCGGSGAYVEGDIDKGSMTSLTIYLNRAGGGHGPGGGSQTGGGFGAVYNSTNGYLMIAGAGGSGFGNFGYYGGGGGYLQGFEGGSPTLPGAQIIARNKSNGGGGSQTQGGQGGWGNSSGLQAASDGGYLQGGNAVSGSSYGNGGGGGYYGGGGGNGDGYETGYTGAGAGGGGSSYVNAGFVKNYKGADGQNGTTSSVLPGGSSSPFYVSGYGVGTYNGAGGGALVVIVPYLSGGGGGTSSTSPPLTIRLNNQVNANANQTFIGTSAVQTFTVPNGVFWIRFFLWGAGGTCQDGSKVARPDAAGSGAYTEGNLRTAPGTVFYIIVGRAGLTGLANGGGGGGVVGTNGGGFTGIFSGSPAFGNAIAIAGGGGGSGINGGGNGGGGGYPAGANSSAGTAPGGTQTAGGVGSSGTGSQLQGADGNGTGGGGGGYYGGGTGTGSGSGPGGGGGSSYYSASVINPITVNGLSTATNGTNTRAANETSLLWVSPYGRSGYDGYAVIGFNTNTSSLPIQITLGNVLSSTATAFITDGATYTIPPKTSKIRIFVWGGGGNGLNYGSAGCGGSGAHVQGDFTVGSITSLTIYLNRGAGNGIFGNNGAGYGAVYNATTGYLLIAGAGGGSGSGYGGGGGYLQGFNGGSPSIAGQVSVQSTAALGSGGGGGSQTQGGAGALSAQAGGYLQGGTSEASAYPSGGGGGYYGGGGGNGNGGGGVRSGNGPGGGGSSYINLSYIKNYMGFDGQSGSTSSVLPGGASSPYYVSGYGVGGRLTNGGGALVIIVPYVS